MEEVVIKFYRQLLRTGFTHADTLEHPLIFINVADKDTPLCGNTSNLMEIYVNVISNVVDDIRYACACNPTANVAVEILCILVKGKNIDDIAGLKGEHFFPIPADRWKKLRIKA